MKLFNFYSKTVKIQYRNQLCSTTTFVVCALTLAAFVIPYYLLTSIKHGELWENHRLLYEKPNVAFPYQYLFLAELEDVDDKPTTSVVTCSSFVSYNMLTEQLHPCSGIRVVPIDSDHDQSIDHLSVGIAFNPPETTSRLTYYTFYFFLEAKVKSQCSFEVPAFVSLEKHPSPTSKMPSGTIIHRGVLRAKQTTALQCPFFMRNQKSHFNHRYYPNENTTLEGFKPDSISEQILTSNPAYFQLHSQQVTWKVDDSGSIDITVEISIGGTESRETALLYKTSLWWKVCQFWSGYFPLLLVSLWLTAKVKRYLFEQFYLRAVEVVPWKEKYI
ncbi:transmembrane protein 231 [Anopheles ziemanni]|uniref:transmembrane protein 231 n=1 Tax=Anopheles coustani TaxID=139045 RepID=UPI00265A47DE|nr:transmembrane protein 231 [Anopheles coustani]XP_058179053.1 transmembrane protein 231 [Anopheles ziemanni]